MRLKDKVILVTGSTTGIGKAIAVRCVSEGARVVIHGLETDWSARVVEELGHDNALAIPGDFSAPETPSELIQKTIAHYGKLDGLVNNAARVVSSNIENTDVSFLRDVLEVNTVAPFALIREALPYLAKSKGVVLNIGSVNAYSGEPNLLAYSISKGQLKR